MFKPFELRIVWIFLFSFSLIGCVWQLYDISTLYFSYKTTVNVQFEQETPVELPAVTFCTNTGYVLQKEYLRQTLDENKLKIIDNSNDSTNIYQEHLRNLTLREQLINGTLRGHQFFNQCLVMKPQSKEDLLSDFISCEKVVPYFESINYERKCYTISTQLHNESNDNYRVNHDMTIQDNSFPLYVIYLKRRHSNNLLFFIHPRSQPFLGFAGGLSNGMKLNFKKWGSIAVTYLKTTTTLLPPPHETNCMNYMTIGYKSHSHCITKCKVKLFQELFGGWHSDLAYNTEYDPNIRFAERDWSFNKSTDKHISDKCGNICGKKQNCFNEYFSTHIIAKWERNELKNYDDLDEVLIYLPAVNTQSGLNTRYVHTPRLHFIEYICYTASVLSLWFGISMITITKGFVVSYEFYRNEKKRRLSISSIVSISSLTYYLKKNINNNN